MNATSTAKQRPVSWIYERCSSKKQVAGSTADRQDEINRACAEHFGFDLADEPLFDAVSAYRGDNFEANLGHILAQIKPGQGLIFEDMRRFSRQNWKTAVDYLERFLAKGVKVMTAQNRQMITLESFRTDPGSFLPVILAAHQAHDENAQKAYYVRKSWELKRAEIREGTAIRQRLPGWLYHEKSVVGGRMVLGAVKIDESKAATVKEIFRLTLAGWSRRRIARHFNEQRVPSVSGFGRGWNGQNILFWIIKNPACIGHYLNRKTGEVFKDVFPPVVDEKTFYAANATVGERKGQTARATALAANLFTGLVRCPTCGGTMSLWTKQERSAKCYGYLRCSQSIRGKVQTECNCSPRYEVFEASMLALMKDSATLRKALRQQSEGPDELTGLRGKVLASDAKLNELMAMLEAAPSKTLAARVQVLEAEGEALRAELQTKEAKAKAATPPAAVYEEFVSELAAHITEPDYRERVKVALRGMIERIDLIDRTAYRVQFKGGAHVNVYGVQDVVRWDLCHSVGKSPVA